MASIPDPRSDREDVPHVHRMWAEDRASAGLGIECLEVTVRHEGLGLARARMRVTVEMTNGHGTCHGGYVFALADSAFALACNAGGRPTVAAGADIEYVTPVHAGDVLLAVARERASYGRSGLTDVRVTRVGDDALVAEFRGRSRAVTAQSRHR